MKRLALIGGRGYTGAELLTLLAGHPGLELAFASSGSRAGAPLREVCPAWPEPEDRFVAVDRSQLADHDADAWVLAVPNGAAAAWAEAIAAAHPEALIVDLSADHRFDARWVYGLPEHERAALRGARRIANPGCYATAAQLALWPLRDGLAEAPAVFGVSGYSGAGRTPSPRNDPERLADNLLPYQLTGHVHEREIGHRLGRPVRFMPHVAPFFRGITLTIAARLEVPMTVEDLLRRYRAHYGDEPRVRVTGEIPEVAEVRGTPDAIVGGFAVDERDRRQIAVVSVLDNLAKGAASQALQNINLALGFDENAGVVAVNADPAPGAEA